MFKAPSEQFLKLLESGSELLQVNFGKKNT